VRIYGAGSIEDIRRCTDLGVEGILTNPQGFEQYFEGHMTLQEIAEAIVGATDLPVFIQIHGETAEALVERAGRLNEIAPGQIGFKIVANEEGFWAIRDLQRRGIDCIATTLFSPSQASVAACVGAFGICPFVSRARAAGIDPATMLRTIKNGYVALPKPPEIIAVSLKGVADVDMALAAGVDAVAMRYPAIREMMQHPLSERAEALFAANWANVKGEDVGYLGVTGGREAAE